jgi:hypothetical protein
MVLMRDSVNSTNDDRDYHPHHHRDGDDGIPPHSNPGCDPSHDIVSGRHDYIPSDGDNKSSNAIYHGDGRSNNPRSSRGLPLHSA